MLFMLLQSFVLLFGTGFFWKKIQRGLGRSNENIKPDQLTYIIDPILYFKLDKLSIN